MCNLILQIEDLENSSSDQILDYPKSDRNDDLYAVLYTSGSTGRPKGARITHRAILNRLEWQWETFPYKADDICCFKVKLLAAKNHINAPKLFI